MAIYSDEKIEFFDRTIRDKNFKMPQAHFHDKHELYFLEKGKTKYFIGSEIYLLDPGDMIFVPKGEFHKTNGENNSDIERLLFVFDDTFVGDSYREYINELKMDKFIRFPPEKIYKLKGIFHKIEQENRLKAKGYFELEKLYLRETLIMISRYRLKENTIKFSESYKIIQDAAKYISTNYNTDLSLHSLSQRYAISPSHFSKLFKSVTGVGLNEYINIARISAAEKLLIQKQASITTIAAQCGFNDSNYFAAVFKKLKGITPKKFSINR